MTVASLTVAATTFILIAAPTDLVRDQLTQQLREKTGRDIYIAGATSLTILPRVGVTMEKVSMTSPPSMGGEPMARVARIAAEVPLWPLLRGRVEIERVVLYDLELTLRVDSAGRRNWDFASADSPPPTTPVIRAGFLTGAAPRERPDFARRLAVANVRIEDGTIRYIDDQRRSMDEVSRVNVDVRAQRGAGPIDLSGDFLWRRERMRVSANLGSLGDLLNGKASQVAVRITGKPLELGYDGKISIGAGADLSGALTVQAGSLKDATAWLGRSDATRSNSGPLKLAAKLETTKDSIRLADTDLTLGGLTARGQIAIDRRTSTRPRVSADLRLNEIDINRWLRQADVEAPKRERRREARGENTPPAARSIDDLIQRDQTAGQQDNRNSHQPVPQVRSYVARNGWSEVDFDFAVLRLIDGDARIATDRVLYHDVKTGPARISTTLERGVLKATVEDIELYGGRGRGAVAVDATSPDATVQASLLFEDVSGGNLLKDAADFDWISGTGRLSLAVAGRGRTERQVVETLNGSAAIAVRDGALVGFDIPQMIQSLQRGRIPKFERQETEKTEFSELAASFKIEKGTAENRDLRLVSPILTVTGGGTAVLPERTLDYAVRPKLTAVPTGQNSQIAALGFELPVRITGPWDRPTFQPEFGGLAKDPGQAVEAAKEIGRQLKGKSADEIMRDLLENGGEGSTRRKARDAIRQLLKP